MNLLLIVVIVFSIFLAFRKFSPFSFLSLGIIGFATYSVPYIIGYRKPFFGGYISTLVPISREVIYIVFFAWLNLLFFLIFLPRHKLRIRRMHVVDHIFLKRFVKINLIIGLAGYLYLSLKSGMLFFLLPRYCQINNIVTLLWRWFIVAGIVAAFMMSQKNKIEIGTFVFLLFVIFLRGDRTIPTITFSILLVILNYGRKKIPVKIVLGSFLFLVIGVIGGKPLYTSIKYHRLETLFLAIQNIKYSIISQFEPFITASHLELVVDTQFKIPLPDYIYSFIGSFLMIPSLFSINANIYNYYITKYVLINISYGVGGNYIAAGWSVGRNVGVLLFIMIYILILWVSDLLYMKYKRFGRLFGTLVGGVTAVYIYRNDLINYISFIRQIFLTLFIVSFIVELTLFIKIKNTKTHEINTNIQWRNH